MTLKEYLIDYARGTGNKGNRGKADSEKSNPSRRKEFRRLYGKIWLKIEKGNQDFIF